MASIHKEITVEVTPEMAWSALRRIGDAHELFTPVLVDGRLAGDTRTVRFANGMVVRERILAVDENRRRVAYTVLDGPGITYHHASMEIQNAGPGCSRFVWITDFLPEEVGPNLAPLIDQGAAALKRNLEVS
jgi:Polyketide cyclase / dehydrase and lipid transport